jgi:type II secretory pathway component PulF
MTADIRSQIHQQLESEAVAPVAKPRSAAFFQRASRVEVAGFFRELAILLNAGYTAPRALRLLAGTLTNRDLRQCVEAVANETDTGADLSRSFAPYHWYFDEVTCSVVEASERAGRLPEGAEYLADLMEEDQELRDRIGNALAYPVVLLGLGFTVVLILLFFVVPTFARFLMEASASGELTGMPALMYKLSLFLRHPVGFLSVMSGAVATAFFVARFRAHNPATFDRIIGRTPIFGRIMVLRSLTRFASTLRMLTVNGVTLRDALTLSRGSLRNRYLETAVDDMVAAAEEGRDFVEPLQDYSLIPPVFIDMLAVGAESGQLPQMLHHMARSMRAKLLRMTERLMVLLQPLMLVFMGAMVVSMFLFYLFPYFDLLMEVSRPS